MKPDDREYILGFTAGFEEAQDQAEAEIARLREAVMPAVASLAAAISLLERSPKTGAASSKMFDIMLNDYGKALDTARAALKPDTGEMP